MFCPLTNIGVRKCSLPDNLINEILFSKNLIHQYLYIMTYMTIKLNINTCFVAHNALHSHKVLIHPIEVTLFIPYVTIHLFFKGLQILNVKFAFSLGNRCSYLWISTYIHLLGVVGTACKGRVNIDEISKDAFVSKISTSRQTLTTNHQIVWILAYLLFQLHFVEGHTTLHSFYNLVVVTIAQHSFCAYKIV